MYKHLTEEEKAITYPLKSTSLTEYLATLDGYACDAFPLYTEE